MSIGMSDALYKARMTVCIVAARGSDTSCRSGKRAYLPSEGKIKNISGTLSALRRSSLDALNIFP